MHLVLHIGTGKTGSKAVQSFLNANEARLKHLGCLWPSSGRDGFWHRKLFADFHPGMINALRHEFQGYNSALISFEGAYRAEDHVLDGLGQLCERISIVIFIRSQVGWINSVYNQLFKAHRQTVSDIHNFNFRQADVLKRFDLNFHLKRWERFFDQTHIKVVPYDPTKSSVEPVVTCMDLPEAERAQLSYPAGNPNKAADSRSLRILYSVKKQIGDNDSDRLTKAVSLAHERLGGQWIDTRCDPAPMLLSAQDVRFIESTFRESNRALIDRYQIDDGDFPARKPEYSLGKDPHLFQPSSEEVDFANAVVFAVS